MFERGFWLILKGITILGLALFMILLYREYFGVMLNFAWQAADYLSFGLSCVYTVGCNAIFIGGIVFVIREF